MVVMPEEVELLHLRLCLSHQQQCHPDLHLPNYGTNRARRYICIFFSIRKIKRRQSYPNFEAHETELLPGKLFWIDLIIKASLVGPFSRGS